MVGVAPTRRACLAGLAGLAAAPGAAIAAAAAPRVACLEWTAAEMVMTLGVAPLAVGDTAGYRTWVVEPALPPATVDLGNRSEPNLELLRRLKPDLVVATYGYGLDEASFSAFAPTFGLVLDTPGTSPYRQAQAEVLRLGRRLGREAEAAAAIARVEADLDGLAADIASQRKGPLAVTSFVDDRHLRIYGAGSLLADVLVRLGIANAWTGETNSWGFATIGMERLAAVGEARLVLIEPIPRPLRRAMAESSLWANLPCVRAHAPAVLPTVWPFGGVLAAARFARLIAGPATEP